jgi:hypothetical protein
MEKLLNVPFFKQTSENNCGVAMLEMIIGYRKSIDDRQVLDQLVLHAIQYANQQFNANIDPEMGITPNAMGDLMSLCEISACRYTYPNVALEFSSIKSAIDDDPQDDKDPHKGSPIPVYIQNGTENGSYGHYLLIVGYGIDPNSDNREYIVVHDPLKGKFINIWDDSFPESYYNEGKWIWGETWILS